MCRFAILSFFLCLIFSVFVVGNSPRQFLTQPPSLERGRHFTLPKQKMEFRALLENSISTRAHSTMKSPLEKNPAYGLLPPTKIRRVPLNFPTIFPQWGLVGFTPWFGFCTCSSREQGVSLERERVDFFPSAVGLSRRYLEAELSALPFIFLRFVDLRFTLLLPPLWDTGKESLLVRKLALWQRQGFTRAYVVWLLSKQFYIVHSHRVLDKP